MKYNCMNGILTTEDNRNLQSKIACAFVVRIVVNLMFKRSVFSECVMELFFLWPPAQPGWAVHILPKQAAKSSSILVVSRHLDDNGRNDSFNELPNLLCRRWTQSYGAGGEVEVEILPQTEAKNRRKLSRVDMKPFMRVVRCWSPRCRPPPRRRFIFFAPYSVTRAFMDINIRRFLLQAL